MTRLSYLPRFVAGAAVFCAASLRAADPVFPAHPDGTDTPLTVPIGKTLVLPVPCDDADGDVLTYTVTSSNARVFARLKTGNPHVKIHVHTDNDGSGSAYDGDLEFELFRSFAPETAASIAGYAQAGYYDNVTFHRIVPDFVIQGGDPAGTGSGQVYQLDAQGRIVYNTQGSPTVLADYNENYKLPNEFSPELIFSGRGQLAMANSGYGGGFQYTGNPRYFTANYDATNGTQFFMTLGPQRFLDFKHTIYGQLVRGFDTMTKLATVPTTSRVTSNDPNNPNYHLPALDNRPNSDVKMTSVSVAPSRTDASLFVTAIAPGMSTLKVTATDSAGHSASRLIAVTAVADTTNDPPILEPLPPVVMPLGGVPEIQLHTIDLESDAVSARFPVEDGINQQVIYAGLNANNLQAVAPTSERAWDLAISVAGLNDPLTTSSPFSASRFQLLEVGIGDRVISAAPETIEATAGVATGTITVATFRHGGLNSAPADFNATVIWGDGTNGEFSTGNTPTVTVVRSVANPSVFEVRCAHTYTHPGSYPLKVVVDGPLGAVGKAKGSVAVNAAGATLKALGADLEFNASPLFSGRPVATFTDSTAGALAGNFSALIDWGDGQRLPGVIRQTGVGRFSVFGTHRYLDPTRYAVAVHIHRTAPATDVVAWSSIKMGGFVGPAQVPPFAKANITSYWSGAPTKFYRGNAVDVLGTLFVINGGQKPTTKWKLRTWLSTDAVLNTTGANPDIPLKMGPLTKLVTEIPLSALPPGGGGNFGFQNNGTNADFTIRMPAGETGAGKYVIAQLVYNDPITDQMAVPKAIPFGPLKGIIVSSPLFTNSYSLALKEGAVGTPQHTATFRVKLDTLPTADVNIPLEIINTSTGAVDNTRATLDQSSLTFNSTFGTSEQIVTVTVVDDAVHNTGGANFVIRVKPATSTDTRFSGMDGQDISLTVTDND